MVVRRRVAYVIVGYIKSNIVAFAKSGLVIAVVGAGIILPN